MQEYFRKIDLKFENLEDIKGDLLFRYGAIFYYTIKSENLLREIERKFYDKPKKYFYVDIFDYLDPHFDRGAESCLNFYIEAGNYMTNFWEISNKNYTQLDTSLVRVGESKQIKVKSKFRKQDLIKMNSFNAENNSCYLLNISKIHSVDKIENTAKKRSMLQLQWDCNYDDLVKIIKKNHD